MIEYIQSALLIISAILIITSAIGLLSLNNNTKNKVYARIHIVGIFDIACILTMIAVGQYLLAGIYFIIAPFTAHAIANAYWKSEDVENNEKLQNVVEEIPENHPFIHHKSKIQDIEKKGDFTEDIKSDMRFSISKLDINEEE